MAPEAFRVKARPVGVPFARLVAFDSDMLRTVIAAARREEGEADDCEQEDRVRARSVADRRRLLDSGDLFGGPMLAGAVAGPLATGVALAALWAVLESRTGTPWTVASWLLFAAVMATGLMGLAVSLFPDGPLSRALGGRAPVNGAHFLGFMLFLQVHLFVNLSQSQPREAATSGAAGARPDATAM